MKKCKICNNKHFGKGYCSKHYMQIRLYGKILKRTIKDKNEIIDCGDYLEIILCNIQCQEIARTKIDENDLDKIKNIKWHLGNHGYAANTKQNLRLHNLIMGNKKNLVIDHINQNKLDNRKQNLRYCSYSQNLINSNKTKGIYWRKDKKKWKVKIGINYKTIHLGLYSDKRDALKIRKSAVKQYLNLC